MNRKIKFRIYKGKTCYAEDDDFVINSSGQLFELTKGGMSKVDFGWGVSQFTGLKDKNGKEIYEGDILGPVKDTEYKQPPKGLLCTVVWDNDWVSFKGLKDNKGDGEYILVKGNAEKHWEIIGNIYENKELLTN